MAQTTDPLPALPPTHLAARERERMVLLLHARLLVSLLLCLFQSVDMWSMGVIIYIILAGYRPFDAMDQARLRRKIKAGVFRFHDECWSEVSNEAKVNRERDRPHPPAPFAVVCPACGVTLRCSSFPLLRFVGYMCCCRACK